MPVAPAAGVSAPRRKDGTSSCAATTCSPTTTPGTGHWSMQWRTLRMVDGPGSLMARARLGDGTPTPSRCRRRCRTAGRRRLSAASVRRLAGSTPAPGRRFRLVAVGDGADGSAREAAVAGQIASWTPNLLAYLGDVYERGSPHDSTTGTPSPDGLSAGSATSPTRCRATTSTTRRGRPATSTTGANIAALLQLRRRRLARRRPRLEPRSTARCSPGTRAVRLAGRRPGRQPGALHDRLQHHPRYSVAGHKGKTRPVGGLALLADRRVTLALAGQPAPSERWAALNQDGAPERAGRDALVAGAGGHEAVPGVLLRRAGGEVRGRAGALRLDLGRRRRLRLPHRTRRPGRRRLGRLHEHRRRAAADTARLVASATSATRRRCRGRRRRTSSTWPATPSSTTVVLVATLGRGDHVVRRHRSGERLDVLLDRGRLRPLGQRLGAVLARVADDAVAAAARGCRRRGCWPSCAAPADTPRGYRQISAVGRRRPRRLQRRRRGADRRGHLGPTLRASCG